MKGIWIILILIVSINLSLFGQSVTIFDVDTTNYPYMKAKIFVMDANGNQVSNLSPADFILKENGISRTVTNVSCPINNPVKHVSLALSIDASYSMFENVFNSAAQRSQKTVRKIIELTTSPPSEIALLSCNRITSVLSDFTTNKSQLLSLVTAINFEDFYNLKEQLLNPNVGLLNIAKTGKFDKSVALFTTGCGYNLGENDLKSCIDTCLKYKIKFYAFVYANYCYKCGLIDSFKKLAEITGGMVYESIYSDENTLNTAYLFRELIQEGDYCNIEWQSDFSCSKGFTDLELKVNDLEVSSVIKYKTTDTSLASLIFSPNSVYFKNKLPNKTYDTSIKVTAINSNFNVVEIRNTNSAFSITPSSFSLNAGESIDLNLNFKPDDSSYTYSKFDLISDKCINNFYSSGGFNGVKPKNGTLKLIYPNGNEKIGTGSELSITWEGISESEKCVLEYSTDSGLTWNLITENASGLSYLWRNIPDSTSNLCLIRIKQKDISGGYDNKPCIEWANTYGGSGWDDAYTICSTSDGGYLVGGQSTSNDLEVLNNGMTDMYVIKLDMYGNIIWQQNYGGAGTDNTQSIQETKDGNYIICGHLDGDFGIIKIDVNGNILWKQKYGGSDFDIAQSIIECKDGGYTVVGVTYSKDGDIVKHFGRSDWWVLRLDELGKLIWQNTFGDSTRDWVYQINQLTDENFIIVGESIPINDDAGYNNIGESKIIKINKNGELIWEKSFGGSRSDDFRSFFETRDGGILVGGSTYSKDGNISYNHGGTDFWIIKLDSNANIVSEKTYGGSSDEFFAKLTQTYDGNFVCVGSSASIDGELTDNKGKADFWIIKIDSVGKLIWQYSLGGSYDDYAISVDKTGDGGLIVAGYTQSFDGDVKGFKGTHDYWVIKFSPDGITLQEDVSDSTFSIVAPSAESRDIDMGDCLIGLDKDSLFTEFIHNKSEYKILIDSVYFCGEDSSAFSFVPEFSSYEIEAGEYGICQIKFTPFKEATHNANFKIITQSDTLIQSISGTGYQPQIIVSSDFVNFGEVELGNYKQIQDSTLIKNISNLPVKINNIFQNDFGRSQFEVENGNDWFILQPNEKRKIQMKFKPHYGGRSTGQLEFNFDGVGSPAVAQLFGIGKAVSIKVSNDSARAGEKINLKLNLINIKPEYLATLATNYEVLIRFQKTILAPENYSNVKIVNDTTYLTFSGKLVNSTEIPITPLIAGLGNVSETSVDIIEFNLTDDVGNKVDYNFEYESGIFNLLGICEEGGKRLINPNSNGDLINISPNPNDGNLKVELNLIESGLTKIKIFSYSGQLVYEKGISAFTGKMEFDVNTENLSNGIYFVNLQTPTINKILKLVVFR